MTNKLLTCSGLKAAIGKTDSADIVDGPLGKALKLYEFFDDDKMNERRDALDRIIEAVPAAKKKAASYDRAVLKYLDDVLKAANDEHRKIDAYLEKFGMKRVKVQVLMKDWKGEPMQGRMVFVVFKCPGKPEITLKQDIKAGVLDFDGVELAPSGAVFINAFPSHGASDQARGNEAYDLPKSGFLRIKAKQKSRDEKTKATSAKEATTKLGLKGTSGIDFVVKVGGEIVRDHEDKTNQGKEVEYTTALPEGALEIEIAK